MWAVESGSCPPEAGDEIVKFRMARSFGFLPEAVDGMSNREVESLLFIEQQIGEKERREMESRR